MLRIWMPSESAWFFTTKSKGSEPYQHQQNFSTRCLLPLVWSCSHRLSRNIFWSENMRRGKAAMLQGGYYRCILTRLSLWSEVSHQSSSKLDQPVQAPQEQNHQDCGMSVHTVLTCYIPFSHFTLCCTPGHHKSLFAVLRLPISPSSWKKSPSLFFPFENMHLIHYKQRIICGLISSFLGVNFWNKMEDANRLRLKKFLQKQSFSLFKV